MSSAAQHSTGNPVSEYQEILNGYLEARAHHPVAAQEIQPFVWSSLQKLADQHPANELLQELHRATTEQSWAEEEA